MGVRRPETFGSKTIHDTVVSSTAHHVTECNEPITEGRHAPVVFKTHHQSSVDLRAKIAHGARRATSRRDVNQTESFKLVVTFHAEVTSEYLQTRAHGKYLGAVAYSFAKIRCTKNLAGEPLWSVLSSTHEIERRRWHCVVATHLDDLARDASSPRARDEHRRVTAIAVRTEQVGQECRDPQHGVDLSSHSLKAV